MIEIWKCSGCCLHLRFACYCRGETIDDIRERELALFRSLLHVSPVFSSPGMPCAVSKRSLVWKPPFRAHSSATTRDLMNGITHARSISLNAISERLGRRLYRFRYSIYLNQRRWLVIELKDFYVLFQRKKEIIWFYDKCYCKIIKKCFAVKSFNIYYVRTRSNEKSAVGKIRVCI